MPEPTRRPAGQILRSYGMRQVGRFFLRNEGFIIEIEDGQVSDLIESIYVFAIDDEITRIGCSAAPLADRFRRWQRDITGALRGLRTQTPPWEAIEWKRRLEAFGEGQIFAKQAHEVTTSPVGPFRALLDEERILIARHRPSLNRSHR